MPSTVAPRTVIVFGRSAAAPGAATDGLGSGCPGDSLMGLPGQRALPGSRHRRTRRRKKGRRTTGGGAPPPTPASRGGGRRGGPRPPRGGGWPRGGGGGACYQ